MIEEGNQPEVTPVAVEITGRIVGLRFSATLNTWVVIIAPEDQSKFSGPTVYLEAEYGPAPGTNLNPEEYELVKTPVVVGVQFAEWNTFLRRRS